MPILPYVKLYVISLLIFIVVDLIWIAGIMKNFTGCNWDPCPG